MKFLSKDWFKSKIEQATEKVAKKLVTKKLETIIQEAEENSNEKRGSLIRILYILMVI